MPLYDFHCQQCDSIFEKILAISALYDVICCPYCQQTIPATPMLTGKPQVQIKQRWQPANASERLAGCQTYGPGTRENGNKNSVLHNCRGMNCSICAK